MREKQKGQVLVSAALMLVLLLGAAGLGIDMGVLRYEKRLQQTAADGAAIAAATDLAPYTGYQTGALNSSAANGFTDNTGGGACVTPPTDLAVGSITVTVCTPPSTGPHSGQAHYVETFVTAGQPTYFMRIFGVTRKTITARAVATNTSGGTAGNTSGCLYTLGPPSSSVEGVNINGNATLNAPTCGIVDNGNFNTQGNSLDVNAATFGVSGSANQSGPGGTVTCTASATCPAYGTPAAGDPLATITAPTAGTPVNWTGTAVAGTTYSGINITGNGAVNFPPGLYIISGGDFTCHGTPTITGTGVTFYFTNGATFSCTGNDTIQFSAPSTGTYAGILFYQDPIDTSGPSLGGNTGSYFHGILYFPKSQITFFGNNTTISTGIVIADAFALSGHPTVNLEGAAGVPGGLPPLFTASTATLVE